LGTSFVSQGKILRVVVEEEEKEEEEEEDFMMASETKHARERQKSSRGFRVYIQC
jgi:hypothetical protein